MARRLVPFSTATLLLLLWGLTALGGCDRHRVPSSGHGGGDTFTGQVLYQINIAEFSTAGTLDGAIAHLDGLQELGIEILVLNPIHPAGGLPGDTTAAHPYAVRDHLAVAPELGDVAAFERFCAAAHARGQRVLLDMVLNHGSLDHAEILQHPEYFLRDQAGQPTREVAAWRTIADFDHDDAGARAYLERVLRTWAQRGADGFRCLHADLVPAGFWRDALAAARRARPGLRLIADSRDPGHLAVGFDAILRPQYLEACRFAMMDDFAQRGLHEDLWLAAADTSIVERGAAIHFLEDRFGERAARAFSWPHGIGYVVAMLTLPGHPQLYSGQEWGATQPPRLHRPVPLDRTARDARWESLYRELLGLRHRSDAVRQGETRRVPCDEQGVLVYLRESPEETVLVAVNLSEFQPTVALPVAVTGKRWRRWSSGAFAADPEEIPADLTLAPRSWRVWREGP